MFIELLELFLSMLHFHLASLTPVPGDAGMFSYEFWNVQLDAIRIAGLLPPGCRTYEDYEAMQVITSWFNTLLDIMGSTMRLSYQCVEG